MIKSAFSTLIASEITVATQTKRRCGVVLFALGCMGLQAEVSETEILQDLEQRLIDEESAKLRVFDALAAHGLDKSNEFVPADRKHVAGTILGKIEAGVHAAFDAEDGSFSVAERTVVDSLEWFTGIKIKSEGHREAVSEFFNERANRREIGERSVCEGALDAEVSDGEFVEALISYESVLRDFVSDYETLKSILPGDVVAALHQREGEFARAVVQADKFDQMQGFYRDVPDVMGADWLHRCASTPSSEVSS